jgi:hypothetical protein
VSTLYEYYNTGDDSSQPFWDTRWEAQTFTPSTTHTITSVKLRLYRVGSPGTITVGIRATDGDGHPTGEDLCSGTTDGDTLTTDSGGEWREITLGSGYELSASTKYAIVGRTSRGYSDRVNWLKDASSPLYAGGQRERSDDAGSFWTGYSNNDYMFEDWGGSSATEKTSSDAGSGAEGTPLPGASLAGIESGSGTEAIIARLLAALDTGYGVEAASLEGGGLLKELFASELGEGSDGLTAKIEMPIKGGGMKLWT